MADRADEIKPPVASSGPLGWVRANLVDTWYNALLTVAVLAALYSVVRGFAGWALNTAEWAVLTQNLQVLLVGQYSDEEVWRAGLVMLALPFRTGPGLVGVAPASAGGSPSAWRWRRRCWRRCRSSSPASAPAFASTCCSTRCWWEPAGWWAATRCSARRAGCWGPGCCCSWAGWCSCAASTPARRCRSSAPSSGAA